MERLARFRRVRPKPDRLRGSRPPHPRRCFMRQDVLCLFAAASAASALALPSAAQDAPGFCEAGFVLADEDGDGILELTEAEALWGQEFGALDADASGAVTTEEFAACLGQAASGEIPPRNVSPTGSGELGGSGVQVELEGLSDGSLTRQEFMDAALSAFDATGNEEDNQLEWARAFVLLTASESETDIRSLGRDGFAARAAALFRRLDADGSGDLSPEEWVGEGAGQGTTSFEAEFQGLDADASGDVTLTEYSEAGASRFSRAREAALAAGWEDTGEYAAGIGTEQGEGEVVSTDSEGLAGEDGETGTDAAQPTAEAGVAEATADADAGAEGGADAAGAGGGVPVDAYRFGLGD
jgi:hypothetical protein